MLDLFSILFLCEDLISGILKLTTPYSFYEEANFVTEVYFGTGSPIKQVFHLSHWAGKKKPESLNSKDNKTLPDLCL